MPRLAASGPTLASSPFDVDPSRTYVALAHRGGLRLYDSADQRELASLNVELGDEVDLVFCLAMGAPRLVVFARGSESTDVRSFALPRLEPSGRLEMIGRIYPAAATLDQVVVWNEAQENVRIVGLAPSTLSAAAFPLREPVQVVVATPDQQILAAARDQYEVWDPMARRASFRIQLPVPRPHRGGFAARRRTLWLLSGPPTTLQLDILRYSDGRPQGRINLGRRVLCTDGQSDSERALFAFAGEAGPELELVDLTTLEREPFAVDGQVAAMCLAEGSHPSVVVADQDHVVRFLRVPEAPLYMAAIAERRSQPHAGRPQLPRRVERMSRPEASAGGSAANRPAPSWRNRLVEKAAEEPHDAHDEEPESDEAPEVAEPEKKAPGPVAAPDHGAVPAWRQQLGRAAATVAEPAAAPKATRSAARPEARAHTPSPRSWRDAILGSSDGRLDGGDLLENSPIEDVVVAFQLAPVARAALTLAYAAWLDGRVKGWAASELVVSLRRLLPAEEDELLWLEALGAGELGQRHLIEVRRGRVRLHEVVGRFLDGVPARLRIFGHDGTPARHAVELGTYQVAEGDLEDTLGRVSRALGHDVAVVDLRSTPVAEQRRELEAAILEAHLESAVPLVVPGEHHADALLDVLDGRLLVMAVPPGAPARLAALPPLPLD